MANILLTGMTAPQTSDSANNKNLSFSGVIYKVLTSSGHNVTWEDPSISYTQADYDKFDSVFVGVAPLTSVSANKAYGALKIINDLWPSPKLRLLIDAPQPSQLAVSFRSILSNPDSLTKPFFAARKNYSMVASNENLKNEILNAVSLLLNHAWPETAYPKLPWKTISASQSKIPDNIFNSLTGINLDAYLIDSSTDISSDTERILKWVSDQADSYWTQRTLKTLALPISPMKINKGSGDAEILWQIKRSVGCLISPYKHDGTWWSYRYIQAINSLTPVVTEWKDSMTIGAEWAVLGASIETYSQEQKNLLAMAQRESYIANIPSKTKSKTLLEKFLGLTGKDK